MNYEELNWPSLPNDIEEKLLEFCQTVPDEDANNLIQGYKQQFLRYDAPDYLKKWVIENIQIDGEYVVQLQIWRHCDIGKRHIDTRRDFSYNYLLMPHSGITRWFEDDGTLIESVQYEYKKWYKHIGGKKYHDVINVNNFRPAVTIFKMLPKDPERKVFWDQLN